MGCDSLRYIDWQTNRHEVLPLVDRSDSGNPFYGLPQRTLVYCPQEADATLEKNVINTLYPNAWHASAISLDDSQPVEVPYAFTTERATVERSFTVGQKSTVYLPFGFNENQTSAMGRFYQYDGYDYVNRAVKFKRVRTPDGVRDLPYPDYVGLPFDPAADPYPYPPEAQALTYDGLHPSDEGNERLAELLAKSLRQLL